MPHSTIRCAATLASEAPSQRISPARGRSRPAMQRISVVLPAPLGPSSATISPARISSVTLESARNGPYEASTSTTCSMAQVHLDDGGIGGDGAGLALGDLLAGAQHDDPLGQRHQRPDDVLD